MTTKFHFSTFNVLGQTVEVKRLTTPAWTSTKTKKKHEAKVWFCAYAELKGAEVLSESYLHVTYKEGNKVGVDTNHAFNEGQNEAQKLASALHQIEYTIQKWKEATQEGYYGEDDD